jgi:hypothetical protein
MQPRRAIAISLYDKFEELEILIEILRENFSGRYLIAVCSNHPDAARKLSKLPIDAFVPGRPIHFDAALPWDTLRPLIVCRSTDTVQRSCRAAIELGAESVCHVHCDAWPLSENALRQHFAAVEGDSRIRFSACGFGFGAYAQDTPVGSIDDHFFFFCARTAAETKLFEFDPLEMLPHKTSVHGILCLQILAKLGLSRFRLYDDQAHCEVWPGRHKELPYFPVKPSAMDRARGFLHVHRQSFPEQLGQALQASYLREWGLTQGAAIDRFLTQHGAASEHVVERLEALHESLRAQLLHHGIDPKPLAQDPQAMQAALASVGRSSRLQDLRRRGLLQGRKLWRLLRHAPEYGYRDSVWPQPVERVYQALIDRAHFPDSARLWFDAEAQPERQEHASWMTPQR